MDCGGKRALQQTVDAQRRRVGGLAGGVVDLQVAKTSKTTAQPGSEYMADTWLNNGPFAGMTTWFSVWASIVCARWSAIFCYGAVAYMLRLCAHGRSSLTLAPVVKIPMSFHRCLLNAGVDQAIHRCLGE